MWNVSVWQLHIFGSTDSTVPLSLLETNVSTLRWNDGPCSPLKYPSDFMFEFSTIPNNEYITENCQLWASNVHIKTHILVINAPYHAVTVPVPSMVVVVYQITVHLHMNLTLSEHFSVLFTCLVWLTVYLRSNHRRSPGVKMYDSNCDILSYKSKK